LTKREKYESLPSFICTSYPGNSAILFPFHASSNPASSSGILKNTSILNRKKIIPL